MWQWSMAVAIYVIAINAITFATFAYDKSIAGREGRRRIRERTLFLLALLGGSPAALVAMQWLRHKNLKPSFRVRMAIIVVIQLAALLTWTYWIWPYNS